MTKNINQYKVWETYIDKTEVVTEVIMQIYKQPHKKITYLWRMNAYTEAIRFSLLS